MQHTDHCRDALCQGCEEVMRDEASITEDNAFRFIDAIESLGGYR